MEDKLRSHIDELPTSEEVEELVHALDPPTLREFSSAILTDSIAYVEGRCDKLAYLQILNSWIATAEETVAAGEDMDEILARRKEKTLIPKA